MDQTQKQLPSFPSIKSLFQESWASFIKSILPLIILNVPIFILLVVIFLVIAGVSFVATVAGMSPTTKTLISTLSTNPSNLLNPHVFTMVVYATIVFFVFIFLISLTSMIMGIASIIVVSNSEQKLGVKKAIGMSFRYVIPLIIIGWVMGFIEMGGLFLFIIPGLLISFFFIFAQYEIVIGGKKWLQAIESSVHTVKSHFGEIAVRSIIIVLVIFGIRYGIPGLFSKADSGLRSVIALTFGLLQPFLTWFSLCYSITLYKHAKSVTPDSTEKNMVWLTVVGVLGWIVAGIIFFVVLMVVKKAYGLNSIQDILKKKNATVQNQISSEESILAYAPTECGLSVPIPKTTSIEDGKTRKWYYEQVPMNRKAFPVLDTDIFPTASVLGEFIGYKDSEFPEDKSSFKVGYPGLNIYCVDNDKNYTLDEFVSLALTSKANKVTKKGSYKWGEVNTVLVWVEGKDLGKDVKDIAYLGVSKDGKRLIYMRVWGTDEKDNQAKQINIDTNTILKYLRYRTVSGTINDMKSTTGSTSQSTNNSSQVQRPSCLQYQVREGEFASNKCYTQTDYNDLNYYINRFNSSAAQYNGAIASMNITCNGSDFFKNSCESDKRKKEQAEKDMNTYRGTIK